MPGMEVMVMPTKQAVHDPTKDVGNEAENGTDDAKHHSKHSSNQPHDHSKNSTTDPNANGNC